ncbi:hypothetical protein PoB_002938600 [Plakobranchus ocellatus]|uniref:Uncharacterized protein n=1 Tax=Plakobranchus ocellatus TaxID=259542 RepID=A0AAV4A864_9GAST|nr:hypothetical protein PoB_002938600 [Plakobranchus ocellatus]
MGFEVGVANVLRTSEIKDKGSYKDQETSQSESTKNVIIAVLSVFAGACAILILVMFSIYVLKLRGASSGREAAPAAPPEFQRPLSDSYEELPEIVTHEGYEQLGERSSPNEYTAATNLDVLHISKGGASERKASSTNSYQSIGSGKFEPRPQVSEKKHSETNLKAAKSFILNDREKHGACASKVLKVRTKSEPCWGRESREREGKTCKVDESDELSPSACFMLGASTESRRHAKASYSAEASGASDNIELKDLTSPICFMLGASTEDKRQTNSFCPAGSNTENGDINMKDLPTPVYFKLVTSKGDQSHEAVFSCFEAKRVENKFAKQNLDTGSCEPDGDGEYLTTLDASREHEDYLELLED